MSRNYLKNVLRENRLVFEDEHFNLAEKLSGDSPELWGDSYKQMSKRVGKGIGWHVSNIFKWLSQQVNCELIRNVCAAENRGKYFTELSPYAVAVLRQSAPNDQRLQQ